MAEPQKAPDRAAMMKILLPAGAVALIVVLIAVLSSFSSNQGRPMSDGSNGSADDPDLRQVAAGLKVRDLRDGTGPGAPAGGTVKVNYTGWLTDGTVFDSGTNSEFPLTGVIRGWQEGIPGMKVGGVRKLVVAPEMGYGSKAQGKIPPFSTLIFEVALVEVKGGGPRAAPLELTDKTKPGDEDPGLKELVPGLRYRDLKEGEGNAVADGATVTIHYTGWLTNGTPFDSSYKTGAPATFPLGTLVKGWQIGIPGMKPGGIRKLVIAPELGYGGRATGDIPPNSTLVFEIELISSR
jgi:peptidylprolyl isomerase